MPEADGVFVKIFRDKEAWKQHEGMLETAKGKFETEEEYRKKLALNLGIEYKPRSLVVQNIGDYYPHFVAGSAEFKCWFNSPGDDVSQVIECSTIPTQVLEEISLVKGLFSKIWVESHKDWVWVVGKIESHQDQRYLIAWWGEKKYYDEIQNKLASLAESKRREEEKKRQEEERKKQEAQEELSRRMGLPAVPQNKLTGTDKAFIAFLVACILALIWTIIPPNKQKQTVSAQTGSTEVREEKKEERPYSYCDDELREIANSVYGLPSGEVVVKKEAKCLYKNKGHYLLLYEVKNVLGRWGYPIIFVSKSVYDKVKVGDKIPFKQPAKPPVPTAKEQKKAEKRQVDEGELWASKVCVICEIETCKSVYELPSGRVYRKNINDCRRGGKHYELEYENDQNEGVWKYDRVYVVESVFNKVKLGDKIPFKRQEY